MVSAWWPSGGGRRIHTGIVTGRWMTKKKRKEKKVPRFRVLVWTHWGSRVRFFFFVCVWSRPFLRPFSLWTCRLPCFLVFFSRDRCWSPFSFQVTRWRQKKNSKRQCDKKKALQEQHTKVTCDADPSVSSFDIRWAVENPVENPVEREEIYWTNENSPDMQGTKSKQPTVGSFHRFFFVSVPTMFDCTVFSSCSGFELLDVTGFRANGKGTKVNSAGGRNCGRFRARRVDGGNKPTLPASGSGYPSADETATDNKPTPTVERTNASDADCCCSVLKRQHASVSRLLPSKSFPIGPVNHLPSLPIFPLKQD